MKSLEQAREERIDREIDAMILAKMKSSRADLAAIGPAARFKLRNILKKYAKSAHPFRECVKDTTPVETVDGAVAIKDLKPGDLVWSYGDGIFELKPIVWNEIIRRDAPVMKLVIEGGDEIIATPDHQFLRSDGSWTEVQALRSGDELFGAPTSHSLARACLAVELPSVDALGDMTSVVAPEMTTRAGDRTPLFDLCDARLEGLMRRECFGNLDLPARGHQGQYGTHNRSGSVAIDAPFISRGVMRDLAGSTTADIANAEDRLEPVQGLDIDLSRDYDEVGGTKIISSASLGGTAVPAEATLAFEKGRGPSQTSNRKVVKIVELEAREEVWDLEVEGNHNFIVFGAIAHNCVRDNLSRFGPGRTEAVCAALKDTIKGTTKWRHGGSNTSESDDVIDADVLLALDAVSESDLQEIFLEIRALEEYQTVEAVSLLGTNGQSELRRWGAGVELVAKEDS